MNIPELSRLKGLLYGFAIGDTLGLGTEFMTKSEAAFRYPDGLKHYDQIYMDSHRAQFEPRHWTLDTDMLLSQIYYLAKKGEFNLNYMAATLQKWWQKSQPSDAPSCVRFVLREPGFSTNPLGTAQRIWKQMKRFEASNEALQRALIMGLWPKKHLEHAMELILITHANSRCAASGAVIAHAVHEIYYNNRVPGLQEMLDIAAKVDKDTLPYIKTAHDGNLVDFKLDDDDTYWYVRKTMGTAMWCLWHDISPEDTLTKILAEAGDANTNAANALALCGLRYGFESLPQQLANDLAQKENLDRMVDVLDNLLKSIARKAENISVGES